MKSAVFKWAMFLLGIVALLVWTVTGRTGESGAVRHHGLPSVVTSCAGDDGWVAEYVVVVDADRASLTWSVNGVELGAAVEANAFRQTVAYDLATTHASLTVSAEWSNGVTWGPVLIFAKQPTGCTVTSTSSTVATTLPPSTTVPPTTTPSTTIPPAETTTTTTTTTTPPTTVPPTTAPSTSAPPTTALVTLPPSR